MDMLGILCFVTCLMPVSALYIEIQRHFEFEDILTENQSDYWVWRSEASGLKTLRLVDPGQTYTIEVYICPKPAEGMDNIIINLDDIRYANDGPWDSISVTYDGQPWAKYLTFEKWAWGHDWNIFRNTGHLGQAQVATYGRHVIALTVETDEWGIELDKIRLNAEFHNLNDTLFCGGRLVIH